jgi:hypothetical protein
MGCGKVTTSRKRRCTLRRASIWLCLAAITTGVTGCVDPLLSPNEPRSQYSRYDLVRGRFAPQYVEDEFGRRKPNLRGRLILPE